MLIPLLGEPEELLHSDEGDLRAADLLPDGRVAFCRGDEVMLLDGNEALLGRIDGPRCRDLAITPTAVFVSDFREWSMVRFALDGSGKSWDAPMDRNPYRLAVNAERAVLGDWSGQLRSVHPATGELQWGLHLAEGPLMATALSPDGRLVATAGWEMQLWLVDAATGEVLGQDRNHSSPVEWVAWTGDGRGVLTASQDELVLRDLDRDQDLKRAHELLSELALAPERPRTPDELGALARALALHGLWEHAAELLDRGGALPLVEQARIRWLAGEFEAAAELFTRAGPDDPYLRLCARAAAAEG